MKKLQELCPLFRPFGLCYEFLTVSTVQTYFLPVIEAVPKFLENLTDEELKKESKARLAIFLTFFYSKIRSGSMLAICKTSFYLVKCPAGVEIYEL